MWRFCIFCYPNRLTWMLICSPAAKDPTLQTAERGRAPCLPEGLPRPCSTALGHSHAPGTMACCGQGAICHWDIKHPAAKAFPSFKVQCCGLGKKKDSSFSFSREVTAGKGTREYLERKKPLGLLCAGLLWSCQVLGWNLPGGSIAASQVWADQWRWSSLCGTKAKATGNFPGAPTPPGCQCFRGRLGIPLGGGDPIIPGPCNGAPDLLGTPLSLTLSFSRQQNSRQWPWPGFKQDWLSSHF